MSELPRLHSIPGGLAERSETERPQAGGEARGELTRPALQPVAGDPGKRPESRRPNEQPRTLRAVREPLWREVLGAELRAMRQANGEKLVETAGRAGISPQYLSEVERGRKEPSSEMIAALAGALGTDLIGLTEQVANALRRQRLAAIPATPRLAPVQRPTAQAYNALLLAA